MKSNDLKVLEYFYKIDEFPLRIYEKGSDKFIYLDGPFTAES